MWRSPIFPKSIIMFIMFGGFIGNPGKGYRETLLKRAIILRSVEFSCGNVSAPGD